jgi:hypothetical protein
MEAEPHRWVRRIKDQRLPAFRFLFLVPGSERKKPKLLD